MGTAEFLRNLTGKRGQSGIANNGFGSFVRSKPKQLTLQNAKHMKELEFLSQKLSSDVADKTQSIANLSTANSVLLEQMHRMKQEMDRMQILIELPMVPCSENKDQCGEFIEFG